MKSRSYFQVKATSLRFGVKQVLLFVVGCSLLSYAKSQTNKRLAMADQYFAAGDYFTAANLYGQFLRPTTKSKYQNDFPLNIKTNGERSIGNYNSRTDVLFKQAESYRLANCLNKALAVYKECFEEDSAKYASALYWIAVCQRSIGNYRAAEEGLDHFFRNSNNGSECYSAALQEKHALQFIKIQLAKPDSVLYHVQKINISTGDKDVFAPVAVNGSQFIFTSTQVHSVASNINPYHNRLFNATLSTNGLLNVAPLIIESIDSSYDQGAASISADGRHLYFTQWKKENGRTVSSIYFSNKTSKGWSKPQLLKSANQQGHNSKQPSCSVDGKYLFFASDRKSGKGGFDIWYAPLLADGTTGEAKNVSAVNSSANEEAPFYHIGSGTLVFASDRTPTMGGYDLFAAKGNISEWKSPENMGYPINSSRDDVYFFATENKGLLGNAFVSSNRNSECCLVTYAVTKTPKKKIVTGVVLDCSNNKPVGDARVRMKDASGKTLEGTTSADGKYSFDLDDDANQHQIIVNKEKYNEKNTEVVIEHIDESNLRADIVFNAQVCVEKKSAVKVENVITVYFDFDKSDLNDRGVEQLDSIYTVMVKNPSFTLQVSGYTDGKGSVAYNKKLSDRRARSCADYLMRKGIDAARISFGFFDFTQFLQPSDVGGNSKEEERRLNRRALIRINDPGK